MPAAGAAKFRANEALRPSLAGSSLPSCLPVVLSAAVICAGVWSTGTGVGVTGATGDDGSEGAGHAGTLISRRELTHTSVPSDHRAEASVCTHATSPRISARSTVTVAKASVRVQIARLWSPEPPPVGTNAPAPSMTASSSRTTVKLVRPAHASCRTIGRPA